MKFSIWDFETFGSSESVHFHRNKSDSHIASIDKEADMKGLQFTECSAFLERWFS